MTSPAISRVKGDEQRLTSGDLGLEYGDPQRLCLDQALDAKRRVYGFHPLILIAEPLQQSPPGVSLRT